MESLMWKIRDKLRTQTREREREREPFHLRQKIHLSDPIPLRRDGPTLAICGRQIRTRSLDKTIKAAMLSEIMDYVTLRLQVKKKKVFVKSVSTKKQANVDHITGDKIPRSFVFSRCKLPGPLKQLRADLRKLMLPYTALKLKEKRENNLRDFLNVAGPMGVTHFLMLSKTPTAAYLGVARTPQGSTLFS